MTTTITLLLVVAAVLWFWRRSLIAKENELENLKVVLHEKRHDLGMREADYLAKYGALKELLQELVPQQLEVVKETGLPLLKLRTAQVTSSALLVRLDYRGVSAGAVFGLDRRLMMLREEIHLAERLAPDLLRQMFAAIENHKRDQERESVPIEWQTQEEFRRDYPPPKDKQGATE